jgi:Fe-S-cluster containining protein
MSGSKSISNGGYDLTWITDNLAVGGAPMSYAQLDALRAQGITAILNLCAEFCDLHEIQAKEGFEVYYLPIADEKAPPLPELEKALAWLDEAIYLGKKAFIHCRHGIGRTGTVLNAYLLRRGLGHRLAAKTLSKLRSKPTNFDQWWTIRRYGRQNARLTVRAPLLEYRHLVDLSPFFEDYEALVDLAESKIPVETNRCGQENADCCRKPVLLSFIECVYLGHKLNVNLESTVRLTAIERAAARPEPGATQLCPLSAEDRCLLFGNRPLACRCFELPPTETETLWSETIAPALARLSRETLFAFTSELPRDEIPLFPLPEAVSGKYVQRFFHFLSGRLLPA